MCCFFFTRIQKYAKSSYFQGNRQVFTSNRRKLDKRINQKSKVHNKGRVGTDKN